MSSDSRKLLEDVFSGVFLTRKSNSPLLFWDRVSVFGNSKILHATNSQNRTRVFNAKRPQSYDSTRPRAQGLPARVGTPAALVVRNASGRSDLWSETRDIAHRSKFIYKALVVRNALTQMRLWPGTSTRGRTAIPSRNTIRRNCYRFPELRVTGLLTSNGACNIRNSQRLEGKKGCPPICHMP